MSNVTPLQNPWEQSPFHVGDRIRKVRELWGYGTRKSEFAKIIGTDRGTLAKYEAGDQRPKETVLASIALRTGARLEWLEHAKGPVFERTGPSSLPDLDSNQEPAGFKPAPVIRLSDRRHSPAATRPSVGAIVTPIRTKLGA